MARRLACVVCALLMFWVAARAGDASATASSGQEDRIVVLENNCLVCSLRVEGGQLVSETLAGQPGWLTAHGSRTVRVEADGDFALELFWTDWSAPGKKDNADNELLVSARDFRLLSVTSNDSARDSKRTHLLFQHRQASLQVLLSYELPADRPYLRRRLAVCDPKRHRHFLHFVWPRRGAIEGPLALVKNGGFGQPAAARIQDGAVFWGVEYPVATTLLKLEQTGSASLSCGHEAGEVVDSLWVQSEWVVTGLCPNPHAKLWFSRYLDDTRVAPLQPYLLYNSWYDVRAPEYTERPEDVMNEANVLRIIRDFQREMWQKRGIRLDAFVLDDGWDVYKSDWVVRPQEFPQGLKPISQALDSLGTDLGIWLGPIGGYSHRDWRVGWMREHGYETVGDQMCVAGTKYHALLKKRVVDFVKEHGVGYFKWDGIQFSCSETEHGHPVGLYSRRATLEAVIDLCQSVRAARPEVFLNITSGTWLSPWWLKYANTIWMQGADYGYADVPSISRRDAAMTYRDHVLFEDYGINDFWFPVANLMTHGIIKGNLQKLGGEDEPLDKFTNNVLLYFARGVTMWELYISPNLLSEGEWEALAQSVAWARDHFDLLVHTAMIGGHPGKREPYGYAHFAGSRGIVAVRNPFIEPKEIPIPLAPGLGIDDKAASLVVERVYPTRHLCPQLYAAGATVHVPLQGYETAVFEIYPLAEANEPLLAGVTFEEEATALDVRHLRMLGEAQEPRLLNPELVAPGVLAEVLSQVGALSAPAGQERRPAGQVSTKRGRGELEAAVQIPAGLAKAELAVLFEREPRTAQSQASLRVRVDGREVQPSIEGDLRSWLWAKLQLPEGEHKVTCRVVGGETKWRGTAAAWLIYWVRPQARELTIPLKQPREAQRPLPPRPWPAGVVERVVKVGEARLP
ncbi:MAG: alpha-galactosidase [candidate division KSB1 bacterium]|nr:alpha-galactosidase [candidate division KSB1 bacterium]